MLEHSRSEAYRRLLAKHREPGTDVGFWRGLWAALRAMLRR
jgi:hypothetical protein